MARALTASSTRASRSEASAGSGAPGPAARRARAASFSVGASAGLEAGGAERAALHARRDARSEAVEHVVDEQRAHARLALVVGRGPAEREQLGRAADDRVEQVALGVEAVLAQAQAQPGGGVERAALLVAEERLGGGRAREGVLAQAAEERRPHAPRAQRARARDRHDPRARVVVGAHLEVVQHARELAGRRHERAIDGREALELAERRAQRPGDARVERLGAGEHPRAAAVRGGEQRAAFGGQAPAQRSRVARRRGEAVELVQDEVGMVGLPQPARRGGGRRPLHAGALLEAIGEPGARELARGAQPGEQVVGAAGAPARSAAARRPRARARCARRRSCAPA